MSVEALTYAKITDLDEAESDGARLLFYVIAENTFNDSGFCKVGQSELVYQTRSALRSIQRRIAALESAGKIKVTRRGGDGSGRKPDQIEIIGFKQWLATQRLHTGKVSQDEQPAKLASCQNVGGNPPTSKGQHANSGGFIKGNRTRESVQETNSNSGFSSEVGLMVRLGTPQHQRWVQHFRATGDFSKIHHSERNDIQVPSEWPPEAMIAKEQAA